MKLNYKFALLLHYKIIETTFVEINTRFMKKLILALLAVSAITTANAQKNSILVYGSAGASFSNTDAGGAPGADRDINTSNYTIAPGIGYQFHKNMTVGLQGSYSRSKYQELQARPANYTLSNTTINNEWQLGAFYRYTHYLSNIFSVYAQANAGYVSGKSTETERTSQTGYADAVGEYDGIQAQLFPAFAVNVHKGWALNFAFGGLQYRSLSAEGAIGNVGFNYQNSFDFTLGQQFNLTITKNIGCGKWGRRGNMKPGSELRRMDISDDSEEDSRPRKSRKSRSTDEDDE